MVTLVHLWSNLDHTTVVDGEKRILRWLEEAGEQPVGGREYFSASAYPLILSFAEQMFGPPDEFGGR